LIADEKFYQLNDLVREIGNVLGKNTRIVHVPFAPLWLAAAVVEAVCVPFKITPPIFRRRVDWFRQKRAFDISKAKLELGYDPKVDLRTGLEHTAVWYKAHGYL
jgi:nucleoside-diphosphate-sugar epimerase